MSRLSQHIALVTLLIATLCIVSSSPLSIQNLSESSSAKAHSGTPIQFPVPIEMLGQGAKMPTSEDLAKERQFNLQKIAQAAQRLKSQDIHQRIMGVEQLNAYQLPEAEKLLLHALQQDKEPEVRMAAAQSLGLFKTLSDQAINQLIVSLQDSESKTRMAALDTLLNYATKVTLDAPRLAQIFDKLTKSVESGLLDHSISTALKTFIDDQKPIKNAFFPNTQISEKTR